MIERQRFFFALRCTFVAVPLVYCNVAAAWWDAGHMLIADIAYQRLTEHARHAVDLRLATMYHENTNRVTYNFDPTHPYYSMMVVSHWPDDIGRYPNHLKVAKTWHYIDLPYSDDGTPLPVSRPRDNIVWAINVFSSHLRQSQASMTSQGRSLAYLVHFVDDIHQPLHCSSLYRKNLPDGDRGCNLLMINYRAGPKGTRITNLHALWDSGLKLFDNYGYSVNLRDMAKLHQLSSQLIAAHPPTSYGQRLQLDRPQQWAQESAVLAKQARGSFGKRRQPSKQYLDKFTATAEQQVVLAGYRLAGLLNDIYSPRDWKYEC